MIVLLFVLGIFFITPLTADDSLTEKKNVKPLYQLPETVIPVNEKDSNLANFIVGSDNGLFKITSNNNALPLWTQGRVDQIIQINTAGEHPAVLVKTP